MRTTFELILDMFAGIAQSDGGADTVGSVTEAGHAALILIHESPVAQRQLLQDELGYVLDDWQDSDALSRGWHIIHTEVSGLVWQEAFVSAETAEVRWAEVVSLLGDSEGDE